VPRHGQQDHGGLALAGVPVRPRLPEGREGMAKYFPDAVRNGETFEVRI
jgi:hypothetical protein